MAGFVPVSHGLFAECYSKGGQLSHGCGHGKGWESPFAFQTVGCFQLHIKKKRKDSKRPLVTKVSCWWVAVENGYGRTGMGRTKF